MDVPDSWAQLRVEHLRGLLMVVGAPDVGKSTFARYLYERLSAAAGCVAFLDGDPGQSTLGPPATVTVAIGEPGRDIFGGTGRIYRRLVGAVSPRGHMLPLLVGVARLARAAYDAGAEAIVYDTSGLIDPAAGGQALKLSEVDLLRPAVVLSLQRGRELEPLLAPLRRSRRVRVIDLRPSMAVERRDVPARQAHRAAQYARHFDGAQPLTVDWAALAVFPGPCFDRQRLVAFEDAEGFVVALGIVVDHDVGARQVTLYTRLRSLSDVDALRLGDVAVDPRSFQDRCLATGG